MSPHLCTCPDTWDCPHCVYECEYCSDMREYPENGVPLTCGGTKQLRYAHDWVPCPGCELCEAKR